MRAPGLSVSRELVLPSLPEDWGNPDTIVLRRDRDARTGCATVRRAVRCAVGRDRGDEEPGGRLPITFPRDERQGPGQEAQQYPGIRDATGALQELHLDEGLLIGYRFWDAKSQTPLFPFGHGLSYTSFKVRASEPRLANDGSVEIDVSVMNTGRRRGASVLQAYLGFPAGTGEPPRQLKAMQRVEVERGATGEATLRLPCDAFRLWDEAGRAWRTPPGEYRIEIGTSSRDIVTEHTVAIGAGAPSCGGGA